MSIITLIEILIIFIGGTLYHFRPSEKIFEAIASNIITKHLIIFKITKNKFFANS